MQIPLFDAGFFMAIPKDPAICAKEGISPNNPILEMGIFRPSILRIFGKGLDF